MNDIRISRKTAWTIVAVMVAINAILFIAAVMQP